MLMLAAKAEEAINSIPDPGVRYLAWYNWRQPWKERTKGNRRLRRIMAVDYLPVTPRVLVNASGPRYVMVQFGADHAVYAPSRAGYRQAMADLYVPSAAPGVELPHRDMRKYWDKWGKGHPYIHVHGAFAAWQEAVEAGFRPWWPRRWDAAKRERKSRAGDASTWYIEGKPRYGKLVKHKCRALDGSDELLPLIMQGVEYGPDAKDYLRACLLLGPSFVCEVKGEPVCWAGTHMGGTLGMIYTPPEHRRKGYAQSLAAFQIDYMLRRHGIVVAHVMVGNKPSEKMMQSLGAQRSPGASVWRSLLWPRWKRKKLLL
jgi:GNAT superfamily N-acetyltransferase